MSDETNESAELTAEEEPSADSIRNMKEMEEPLIDSDQILEEPVETSTGSIRNLKRKEQLQGKVTRLELYGAFIDLGLETEALVHISQLGKDHVNRVSDVLNVDDVVTVWVDKVDPSRNQVMVTMIEPLAVEWSDLQKGNDYTGEVTRLENFGAFINIGAEREGLVHISELSHDYVKHPSEVVTVGDEVKVQVLGFSKKKRRIDLSMKALIDKAEAENGAAPDYAQEVYDEQEEEDLEEMPTAMEIALRRAMGDSYKPRSRSRGRDRGRRGRRRSMQDDILSRTLQSSEENDI